MPILIVDYGLSNIGSVFRSFEECGAEVLISNSKSDFSIAEKIVLPGVGSFHDAMKCLTELDLVEAIKSEVLNNKIPILGICLGMQILATTGVEGGSCDGLGLIPGHIEKIIPKQDECVPHMGWNEVNRRRDCPILNNVSNGTDYYFVHSYHFCPNETEHIAAVTPFASGVVSVVQSDNIYGTQFHPEKSQVAGMRVINSFLEI